LVTAKPVMAFVAIMRRPEHVGDPLWHLPTSPVARQNPALSSTTVSRKARDFGGYHASIGA
jgi:hypothetical protein